MADVGGPPDDDWPVSPSRGLEVDTEYEQEDGEEADPEEVDEEELPGDTAGVDAGADAEEDECRSAPGSAAGSGTASTGDYVMPERHKELWKQVGCDNEAGRILKRLYNTGQASAAGSKVSYPAMKARQKWEPRPAPSKPCPQRAEIRVPRGVRKVDPNDPRNWQHPAGGRKPAHEIIAEMEAHAPERPNLKAGRDNVAEKSDLQDRFRYCGGQMLPKGAMGNVSKGALPKAAPRPVKADPNKVDPETGMTFEQEEIFQELTKAVQWKQERLAEIDGENAADMRPSKARTDRNKEALKLKKDVDECLRSIDTLMKITD